MNSDILTAAKTIRDYHHMQHTIEKSDIIIVLGSHDIRVADRGIDLLQAGFAPKILFSGGLGRLTDTDPKFRKTTEAELFAQRALERGVSKEKILIENTSTNSGENIQFSYNIIKKMPIKSIILVQKPYMERRAFATFSKQRPGKEITFYVTSPNISFETYPNETMPIEKVIDIMVGDFQRIVKYPKKGFQIHQEVPEQVMKAYEELIKAGFTNSLI